MSFRHPTGHQNKQASAVIEVLEEVYRSVEGGSTEDQFASWCSFPYRWENHPRWMVRLHRDSLVAMLDEEFEEELYGNAFHWKAQGITKPPQFQLRLGYYGRLYLAQLLDAALSVPDEVVHDYYHSHPATGELPENATC